MKLNANALALAAAITTAIMWLVCSLFVWMLPGMTMNMSGFMTPTDLSGTQLQMHFTGLLAGLVLWPLCAAVMAWLLAYFYNRLSE